MKLERLRTKLDHVSYMGVVKSIPWELLTKYIEVTGTFPQHCENTWDALRDMSSNET